MISEAGKPFTDPSADAALFAAVRRHLRPGISLVEIDAAINDPVFADACLAALLQNMRKTVEAA